MYLFRSGADIDLNAAAVFARHAADLGDGEAQYLLGQFYLTGEGVPRDASEAARWLAKAADQNVTAAFERVPVGSDRSALVLRRGVELGGDSK